MTEERMLRLEIMISRLMLDHGLTDWSFRWSSARRGFGTCCSQKKLITISTVLANVNTDERVRRTVLHEIAHALVGTRHGHDVVWRSMCLRIGGDGKTCWDRTTTVAVPAPWSGTCPVCHTEHHRYRRPRLHLKYFCRRCFPNLQGSPEHAIIWRNTCSI